MSHPLSPRDIARVDGKPFVAAWSRFAGRRVGWLVASVILSGCAGPLQPLSFHTPDYQPENVFLYSPALPADVKRVTVLPLACDYQRMDLRDGCELLGPIVQAELIKTKKFEIVPVSPDVLRNRTGRTAWMGTEVLPRDLFDSLREVYGCDAVLFCQLTTFRAYAPLAIGWRMKLVDARTRQTLWAADDLVDAGQPAVLNGLKRYRQVELETPDEDQESLFNRLLDLPLSFAELQSSPASQENWLIRNSTQRFGQYAAAQVLTTLPSR
jgi:hypothetical protein